MRTRIALLFAAILALLLSAFAAAPAQAGETHPPKKPGAAVMAASGTCGGYAWYSDRVCLLTWGNGNVVRVLSHIHTGPDGHDYVDGEVYGATTGLTVYFDVSRNGGSTWTGFVDQNYGQTSWSSIYTRGTQYDGPGYWVRTCATAFDGYYVCTGWY
jgi:hypothetical protein